MAVENIGFFTFLGENIGFLTFLGVLSFFILLQPNLKFDDDYGKPTIETSSHVYVIRLGFIVLFTWGVLVSVMRYYLPHLF